MAINQDQVNPGKVGDASWVSERNLKHIVQYNVNEPYSYIEKKYKRPTEQFALIQSTTYCIRWTETLPRERWGGPPAATGMSPVAEAFCEMHPVATFIQ